ncbi:exosortase N [Solitalea canadensis]|uniref:Transmembrane exosortase (Exosortase_EpsH) n=1 Tax=Solitalea canadensis (strain ATCC 29591 / DSM 3403 / JCM 21819 / LMG 8368 / NBRC 15130 / NCIMB 12057 / USAM 9D) TaxID=929556 RepID=H8KXV6_SOLCM|nr:exosortase N [Solitalea canadensis]AFD05632.1 Transmembrane exosortase (Exosortase_EpsH) [Solitalea canadensis DSM 3403]
MIATNKMTIPDEMYKRLFFYSRIVLLIVASFPVLKSYFNTGPLFIGGILIMLYSLQPTEVASKRNWWLLPLTVCFYLSTQGVKTFYFISCVLALGWLIENYYGKINLLPFVALTVVSPIGDYIFNTLTFPFRLQLTQLVTICLNTVGYPIQAGGNLITVKGATFNIDEACSGLKMLETSMLLVILILAHVCKKHHYKLSFLQLLKWIALTLLLGLVANFFRIIFLVLFHIGPEHPFHYTAGIICLLCYCVLPLILLINKYCKGKQVNPVTPFASHHSTSFHVFSLILVCIVAFAGYFVRTKTYLVNPTVSVSGFKSENLTHGIVKLSNDQSLIYLKPLRNFYSTDHNPSICWKGSGYKMDFFTVKTIDDKKIYFGELTNKKDKLYTAWWYQSNVHFTIDQLEWRKRCLINDESFWLVNISAASPMELNNQIKQFIENKTNTSFMISQENKKTPSTHLNNLN